MVSRLLIEENKKKTFLFSKIFMLNHMTFFHCISYTVIVFPLEHLKLKIISSECSQTDELKVAT